VRCSLKGRVEGDQTVIGGDAGIASIAILWLAKSKTDVKGEIAGDVTTLPIAARERSGGAGYTRRRPHDYR
jgi:hypothetical protein